MVGDVKGGSSRDRPAPAGGERRTRVMHGTRCAAIMRASLLLSHARLQETSHSHDRRPKADPHITKAVTLVRHTPCSCKRRMHAAAPAHTLRRCLYALLLPDGRVRAALPAAASPATDVTYLSANQLAHLPIAGEHSLRRQHGSLAVQSARSEPRKLVCTVCAREVRTVVSYVPCEVRAPRTTVRDGLSGS